MVDRDVARDGSVPQTQAGGRYDEDEATPAAPGVGDADEVGEGVSVGDGTLAGPAVGGSLNPPAAGVVGGPGAFAGLVVPPVTSPEAEGQGEEDLARERGDEID